MPRKRFRAEEWLEGEKPPEKLARLMEHFAVPYVEAKQEREIRNGVQKKIVPIIVPWPRHFMKDRIARYIRNIKGIEEFEARSLYGERQEAVGHVIRNIRSAFDRTRGWDRRSRMVWLMELQRNLLEAKKALLKPVSLSREERKAELAEWKEFGIEPRGENAERFLLKAEKAQIQAQLSTVNTILQFIAEKRRELLNE